MKTKDGLIWFVFYFNDQHMEYECIIYCGQKI